MRPDAPELDSEQLPTDAGGSSAEGTAIPAAAEKNEPEAARSQAEEIAPGITREWLGDGRVLCYTIKSVSRKSVDVWADDLIEKSKALPIDRPFLLLQDLADPALSLTPYVRSRVNEHRKACPDLRGRVALILPRMAMAGVIQFIIKQNSTALIRQRAFFDRESALAWLQEETPGR
jgi:hypothetical protein